MTTEERTTNTPDAGADQPHLSFDPRDLMGMRVRPAAFARLCGVSRNAVSQWCRKGLVTLGPDGLLDPVRAVRELMRRGDPKVIRARVFRVALSDLEDNRKRLEDARTQLECLEAQLAEARELARLFGAMVDAMPELLVSREADFRAAEGSQAWRELADQLYEDAEAAAEVAPYLEDEQPDLDAIEAALGTIDAAPGAA
jgi:hypothetical protein